jgi:HEPN domain-containing protein
MKDTTIQWLNFAETDLRTCEKLLDDVFLTNIVAFHSQQIIEKCFKSIIEEQSIQLPRIHTLSRLFGLIQNILTFDVDILMLQKLDTVYTTSRYPSDMGLMPEGKPTVKFVKQLYEFAKNIYENTLKMLDK